jgi:hypothetical protein
MTAATRSNLRSIMLMAWDFRRGEPGRAFADCLRGAWKLSKKLARAAARIVKQAARNGGHLRLSYDLTRSPTKSELRGQRYAGAKAYSACYGRGPFGA